MDLTVDQALKKALEAQRAGGFEKAERYYKAILKAIPGQPDANHNMGVLAVEIGKTREALPFFKSALKNNPKEAQFWISYVGALIKLGELSDANSVRNEAISSGIASDAFTHLDQRLGISSKAHSKDKSLAAAKLNKSSRLRLEPALMLAKRKIKEKKVGEAIQIYKDILTKYPKNKRALLGIKALSRESKDSNGTTGEPPGQQIQELINLYKERKYEVALSSASNLLKYYPNSVNLYNIFGATNQALGNLDAAMSYEEALQVSLTLRVSTIWELFCAKGPAR